MVNAINEQKQLAEHYADVCKEIFGKEDITPDERIEDADGFMHR